MQWHVFLVREGNAVAWLAGEDSLSAVFAAQTYVAGSLGNEVQVSCVQSSVHHHKLERIWHRSRNPQPSLKSFEISNRNPQIIKNSLKAPTEDTCIEMWLL